MAGYLTGMLEIAAAHPGLAYFLELALKSTLLLAITLSAAHALRRTAVARRHLLWCLCVLALCCLPVLIVIMPSIVVTVVVPDVTGAALLDAAALRNPAPWWRLPIQLYLLGVLALLLYTLAGVIGMVLLTRQARQCSSPHALQLLQGMLADELADVEVRLLEHPGIASPLSWGLLNPVIILPVAAAAWPEAKLRHVLLHELGHVQRLDWITQLVGRYVCAVYWYNPLAWLAVRTMGELAEQACDDAVLMAQTSNTGYASDLVAVARDAGERQPWRHLALAMAATFLGSRIAAILDTSRLRRLNDSVWVIRSALLALVVVAVLAGSTLSTAPRFLNLQDERQWGLRRYITVQLFPARPAAPIEVMTEHRLPRRLEFSSNLPPLETIEVTPLLQSGSEPVASAPLVLPVIALEAVPGTRFSALHLMQKQFPVYPAAAARRGIEGHTTIEYDIDADGRVVNPVVIESSPGAVFDQSALDAIGNYVYETPKLNGVPVGIKGLRTRFNFALDPGEG